ncbi:MAG TPA: hypothetical protein VGK42_11855 [Candidatus Dormibacteraeota bacterium]
MSAYDVAITGSFACSAAFFVLAGMVAILRRPHEPPVLPAMSDLGPETPAVANLLANGGRLTPEAVPATLLDLAVRQAVKIEEAEQGTYTCRIGVGPSGILTAYESRVLALLRKRAQGGVVPARALTAGPADEARGWMKAFRSEVVAEANAAGKCAPRWPKSVLTVLGVLGLGALLLGIAGGQEDDMTWPQAIAVGVAILTFIVLGRNFTEDTEMVTPAGLAAQARWLSLRKYLHDDEIFPSLPPTAVANRERYLAYGAALGVAAATVRAIPMGAESDRWAWTRYGGQWQQVRVSYPRRWPPAWGSSPWEVGWTGLLAGGFGVLVLWVTTQMLPSIEFGPGTDQVSRYVSAGIVGATLLGAAAVLLGIIVLAIAVIALIRTRDVTGEAIRVRHFGAEEASRYYLAVYTGVGRRVRAWLVRPLVYSALNEYDVVTVSVSPLIGYVRSVKPAQDDPRALPEPAPSTTA